LSPWSQKRGRTEKGGEEERRGRESRGMFGIPIIPISRQEMVFFEKKRKRKLCLDLWRYDTDQNVQM
jgi:hypothetical protein